MGRALYRKYRSKNLSEIVGQDHITQTLKEALRQGRISHAYLFTGPRGVGKTSIARILAYEINGLEYGNTNGALDIIEIDAASNRRIDEIRELRDKVHVAPSQAKYKVYIIDEVHMLTREAFNALLKTLEEPPEHAVFILATTDAHKLPETIVSRTQRYTFKPVPKEQVAEHLQSIAKSENISATPEALQLLAEHGGGSFRDSISMLDQASSHSSKVDEELVRRLLGIPPEEAINKLMTAVAGGQSASLVTILQGLYDQGFQPAVIAKQLSHAMRRNLLAGEVLVSTEVTFMLLNRLLKVPLSHSPESLLEITLLEALPTVGVTATAKGVPVAAQPEKTVAEQVKPTKKAKSEPQPPTEPAPPKLSDSQPALKEESSDTLPPSKEPEELTATPIQPKDWEGIVELIKKRHNTLYGIIRMAEPEFNDEGTMNLVFSFAFHQKRFNESVNQKAIAAIAEEITGSPISITCSLDTARQPKAPIEELPTVPEPAPQPEQVTAISNIFGGGELLES